MNANRTEIDKIQRRPAQVIVEALRLRMDADQASDI
jgi:hypothetical protein